MYYILYICSMIGYSVVNSKGQVTIPAHIRKSLRVEPGETVVVRKVADAVMIQSMPDVFSLRGSVIPRKRPEDFKKMRKEFVEYLGSRKKS